MTKEHRAALIIGFVVTIAFYAVSWAISVDEIWQSVYDSANQALRLNIVIHN